MITTSPDGQWAAVRQGREVALLANGAGPATARLELDSEDADLVIVGPPSVLVIVTRAGPGHGESTANRLVLHQPPYLEAVARLDLEVPMRIAGVTGPRIALVSLDGKAVTIVRVAGRALSAQAIEPSSPVEFAVGLERNQLLFGLQRKLEAWDAVSGRPLLRMQLPLPPPPRVVGPAHGHLWATRLGSDEILVYRLSDGRPFGHSAGAPISEVICHPGSPLLILVTPRGLVRLHCFAHALTAIDAPWRPGMALAQLVVGDDICLLGVPAQHGEPDAEQDDEPWRVPIGGPGAPPIALEPPEASSEPLVTAADKLRAMRERAPSEAVEPAPPRARDRSAEPADPASWRTRDRGVEPAETAPPYARDRGLDIEPAAPPRAGERGAAPRRLWLGDRRVHAGDARTGESATSDPSWREPLAAYATELLRGAEAEIPAVAADTELGQLVHRLDLPASARDTLVVLYGLYLTGEPTLPIARLARTLGSWTEALAGGELHAHAMLQRRGGRVALRGAVTDLLDGAPPRAIRVVGDDAVQPRPGALRLARGGRSNAEIETELAAQLVRIAVIEGATPRGMLEAYLHRATAVALAPPPARPVPWPRDAAMIVVADPAAAAWIAALPTF